MSTQAAPGIAALRALVARATLAPSTRNSQPWRWTVHPDHVELELDERVAHRLEANDPHGRELVISCGAGLLTFRVAAAEALFDTRIDVLPDPHRPHLLACVTVEPGTVDGAFAALDAVVPLRRTAWNAFDDRPLPAGMADRLEAEAAVEGVRLTAFPVGVRAELAALLRHADEQRYDDPERRAEMAEWITSRWADEGRQLTPAAVVPARAAMRHLDLGARVAAREAAFLAESPYVGVLSTPRDTPADWLAAGQALQRVLLVTAADEVYGGFLNAPCQVDEDREALRDLLPDRGYPQVVLRLGHPVTRPPGSARRRVDEVVTAQGGPDDVAAGDVEGDLPREAGEDFSEDTLG
jgi:nitroreductase